MNLSIKNLLRLFFLASLTTLLAACGKNPAPSSDATMRVLNLSVDIGAVNVAYEDGTDNYVSFASAIDREKNSNYSTVKAGGRNFKVSSVSGGGSLLQQSIVTSADTHYSLILFGTSSSARILTLADNMAEPESGKMRLRVVMAAAGLDALDFYLTPSNADLATTSPTFSGLTGGAVTSTADFTAGQYQLRATISGTKTIVYDGGNFTFADKDRYTLALYTAGSNKLANGVLLKNDDAGMVTYAKNSLGRYRLVQGISDYAAVNAIVDNNVTFSNVPYKGYTGYVSATTQAHNLKIEPTVTPGTYIVNQALSLNAANDHTVLLTGKIGSASAVVVSDNTLPSLIGKARVRFVHGSAGAGKFDVFVNYQISVSALAEQSASGYTDYDPNTYAFSVNNAGTTTQLLNLTSVLLEANNVYTIFLVGQAGALQGVLVKDN